MKRSLHIIGMIMLIIVMLCVAVMLGMTCIYFSTSKEYRKVLFKNEIEEYESTNENEYYIVEAYYDQTDQTRT